MKRMLSTAVAVCLLGATLLAHEITGTVVTAVPASVTITVVDETTRKPAQMTFDIDKKTKILRGTKTVSFADAHIQKGEKVSITIDHELDEQLAVTIKLGEIKK
jgi:hypothetical protein